MMMMSCGFVGLYDLDSDPSLRSVIDTAVARITCGLLHRDRGYVDDDYKSFSQ